MVLLRALEQGRVPPRVTRDLDVLADLRARPAALPRIVTRSPISLVADPFRLRDELGPRNARRIAAVEALDNDEHEAWLLLPQPQRLEGITARTLIVAAT